MSQFTVNFFGSEISIDFSNDLNQLKDSIARKFLFNEQDLEDIVISYFDSKDNKVHISSQSDFEKFLTEETNNLFLDLAQDCKTETKKDSTDHEELVELLVLYNNKKQEKEKADEERKKIEEGFTRRIEELQRMQREFLEKKAKQDYDWLSNSKKIEKRIFELQKKLKMPKSLDLPSACPSTDIILRGKARPKPAGGVVAISFDDGPVGSSSSATSMRIINALVKSGFKATFFYVSNWITNSDKENEIKIAYQKGMEIANHSKSHPNLANLGYGAIQDEVNSCQSKLKQIIGAEPAKLIRLPYLSSSSTVQSALSDYALITCSIDTKDWDNASKDAIVNTVKSAMNNGSADGAIVLCHENYQTTAGAIEELAPYCKQMGWTIDTVSGMFRTKQAELKKGQINTKAVYSGYVYPDSSPSTNTNTNTNTSWGGSGSSSSGSSGSSGSSSGSGDHYNQWWLYGN